ncbi:VOC family protein [Streptomyces sviceus]|uniref:VOC family protein n=1 Tax=Streptomyces sviceus TaxID=285530 RepID=UPI0036E57746
MPGVASIGGISGRFTGDLSTRGAVATHPALRFPLNGRRARVSSALLVHERRRERVLHPGVRVTDVDARHELLTAQGVEILKPPTSQPWGRRSGWLRDRPGHHPPGGKKDRTVPGTVTRARAAGRTTVLGSGLRGGGVR